MGTQRQVAPWRGAVASCWVHPTPPEVKRSLDSEFARLWLSWGVAGAWASEAAQTFVSGRRARNEIIVCLSFRFVALLWTEI